MMKAKREAGTLIVVPVTLLTQWEDEIQTHSIKNSISFLKYYENNQRSGTDLNIYDIVLTTYGIISSEFHSASSKEKPLFKYKWFRIILDEAHYIKGRTI